MKLGLDFGTSNTVLAYNDGSQVKTVKFPLLGEFVSTCRTLIYIPDEDDLPLVAGNEALESYLEEQGAGRVLQSLKSYLAEEGFTSTRIRNRAQTIEALLAIFLSALRKIAETELNSKISAYEITIGRPVRFVNERTPASAELALSRLKRSAEFAGFSRISFEYEPVAAALSYEQQLTHDETLLVGDFGGGTTDFTIIRVGPEARNRSASERILATYGVPVAGDAFDAEIVKHIVSPQLGLGGTYTSLERKRLPIPAWFYQKLSNWHEVSFLREPKTLKSISEVAMLADNRLAAESLLQLIEENLGFALFREIERVKIELTSEQESRINFNLLKAPISGRILRNDFESWLQPKLALISSGVDSCLKHSGLSENNISRVFLTGGSSFVPAVQELFINRFGEEKVAGGKELVSVAEGLAIA